MQSLTSWIQEGLAGLSGKFHARHAGFVAGLQCHDGGWPARQGGSDLYYTSFALRCMDLLRHDDPPATTRAAGFVSRVLAPENLADLFCFLSAQEMLVRRGSLKLSNVGAARKKCAAALRLLPAWKDPSQAGTYDIFLASECWKLLGEKMPDDEEAVRRLLDRQRADGGFSDSESGILSGANPTAAAVMFLSDRGRLDGERAGKAMRFIGTMQKADGGFGAHGGAPCSDLLSTFTGLVALWRLDAPGAADLSGAARFLKLVACAEGGFRGTAQDDTTDVEYTYYGLGTAGILATAAGKRTGPRGCACRKKGLTAERR